MKEKDIEAKLLNHNLNDYRSKKENATTYNPNVTEEERRKRTEASINYEKNKNFSYSIPLNINYEGDLIYYIDSLPSIKPYIVKLIRKEMANPYIENSEYERIYEQSGAKRRSINLKLIKYDPQKPNKENDQDVIDYLCTKKSKRAYLIKLLYQDMQDSGFILPIELQNYNKKSKVKKVNVRRAVYIAIYDFIENKLKNNIKEFKSQELKAYCKENIELEIKGNNFENYRQQLFSKTGVIKFNKGNYIIDKDKFKALDKLD